MKSVGELNSQHFLHVCLCWLQKKSEGNFSQQNNFSCFIAGKCKRSICVSEKNVQQQVYKGTIISYHRLVYNSFPSVSVLQQQKFKLGSEVCKNKHLVNINDYHNLFSHQ